MACAVLPLLSYFSKRIHRDVSAMQEYLELRGILDVQLVAQGATIEDRKCYPARMSRQGNL